VAQSGLADFVGPAPGTLDANNNTTGAGLSLPLAEAVKLGAVDSEFYARTFFQKTFRLPPPPFAQQIWEPLEDPNVRLANIIAFRGSSKTTRLRTFASKRIAYGISRTILYVGASERDAIRSVVWLRNQVERNKLWSSAFNLRPGKKWEETQIEIEHGGFGHTVWVLGAGITGSLRGINFDDYRPDLIIVDDPQTDETASSEEQREKIEDLVLGAVKNSLAPRTEEPNAKVVMAITPQHKDDVSQKALKDSEWVSRVIPCWTLDTLDLDVDKQVSIWPEMFPTPELRKEKTDALRRNKLSIFTREKECKLVAKESAVFLTSWLNVRTGPAPRGHVAVLGVDPVPPPSPRQMAKGLEGKDWETQYVWSRVGGDYHLLDYARSRGHDPSWSVATAFRLMRQWGCVRMVFDAVAYQRTLQWIFEQAMARQRQWFQIIPIADGMQKFARINGTFGGLAAAGKIWIGPEHTIFANQWEEYGPLYGGIDDDLDASALAVQNLSNPYLEQLQSGLPVDSWIEDNPYVASSP
jgi:hypothetical protein